MNIFSCNENSKSYMYPIIKILLCIAFIVTLINREHLVRIENIFANLVVGVICCIIVIVCVLYIYISISEIILIHDHRKKISMDIGSALERSKEYSIDDIVLLLKDNDIIEIMTILNNQIIEISSVSNSRPGSSHFFDKHYCLGKKEFDTIDELRVEMISCFDKKPVRVVSIDGVTPGKTGGRQGKTGDGSLS